MEEKNLSLKSSFVENDESFFNYDIVFLNLFPSQLKNVLSYGEFFQILDDINSIKMTKPHSYMIVLLQSITLYLFLQLMVVTNYITKLTCTIFFSLVLLHFLYVIVTFSKCLYKSFKFKRFLNRLNKQFKERNIRFKTKYETERSNISFSFSFVGKVLFLLIPFFLQLELIYERNPSKYIISLSYIVISIFIIFILNIIKNIILFSKLKKIFFGNTQYDLSQLFFIESLIITYREPVNTSVVDEEIDLITPNYNDSAPLLDHNV
ncbi:hypothetical protein DICPUDRAFT_96420 [Dictyostelium purpureum]|uniref:Uncharacterized protein n=1 Tax=Dictyostelium purpureum TaxID=5786 RepID=F0Z855_DICPU|nr:uncharacterized protein DICPUDRAFT_96420 [Dictyostelium purpureum]EGC39870.1 hypothetical protein DICPUDRAFT_96420 [Dictyostelium purpureum]|eukprot:XP_003283621.1 hypothetical protein DICPUDRAFT_96420 [Dictyostelium purpureum]